MNKDTQKRKEIQIEIAEIRKLIRVSEGLMKKAQMRLRNMDRLL